MCSSPPSTGPKGIGGRIAKYRTVHPLRHMSGPLGVIITYFILSYCVRFDLPTEGVQIWQRLCQPWNTWRAQTRTMQSSAVSSRPLREDVYDTSDDRYATFYSYMHLAKRAASMQSKCAANGGYLMDRCCSESSVRPTYKKSQTSLKVHSKISKMFFRTCLEGPAETQQYLQSCLFV